MLCCCHGYIHTTNVPIIFVVTKVTLAMKVIPQNVKLDVNCEYVILLAYKSPFCLGVSCNFIGLTIMSILEYPETISYVMLL